MRVQKDSFLLNVPVAHRGLHDISKGIPENSYKAFDEAMTAGYAIETDIRFTADGKIVLFHDDELSRLTDGNGKVYDKTYRELSALGLKGTTERIPLFSEFLEHVGGKVPLLIEIKDQPERSDLVKEAAALLKSYRGEYALQAFNPFYLLQMKKYAPDALRGQLGCFYGKFSLKSYIIKNMNLNFMTNPDFISYSISDLPFPKAKRKDTVLLGWTVRSEDAYAHVKDLVDNVIFENIRPPIKHKTDA